MKLTVSQIEQALAHAGGVQSVASDALGVHRSTISRRVARSERLQQVRREARESTLDLAESKLLELIKAGNLTACIYYLKTQGKERGYSERQEVTGAKGGPVGYLQTVRDADRDLREFEAAA
jgi:hypothetical protein